MKRVGLVAMGVKRLVRGLPVVHVTPELIGLLAFGLVLVATTPFRSGEAKPCSLPRMTQQSGT